MPNAKEANIPYRWDLVTPAQFGTLRPVDAQPSLWFLDELVECTAKVVARSGNGHLVFVGRSLDSMFDLLCGALADTDYSDSLDRLPLSFARPVSRRHGKTRIGRITHPHVLKAREILDDLGLSPHALARRSRPVTFVDVVSGGSTFTELFRLLRHWIDSEGENWPVIRLKLRFVGVTDQHRPSPNSYRWQHHEEWPSMLPAKAVVNVSLAYGVWTYLADKQVKLTRTFGPVDWFNAPTGPSRHEHIGDALAEALALVERGRDREVRRALARTITREPAIAEPWLRALVAQLTAR